MPQVAIVSLGCAKNLVDSEIILGQLIDRGWELTTDFEQAELIIVNTCGFIESAKAESVQNILEMSEYKNPGKGVCQKLLVAGCLVQRYSAELIAEIPEVDYWVGLGEIGAVAELIQASLVKKELARQKPFLNDQNLPRYQVTLQHTAYVKIAEGCSHGCSYCAIPLIKGGFRSRSVTAIVQEVAALVNKGVKEINIIAQDITMYGEDLEPSTNLKGLLSEIINIAKPEWIRLLYAYPSGLTDELIQFIAQEPTICKYLDLPLQHINARILKLMNRQDPPELIKERLQQIRRNIPGITLRTTFIVGFPTETEAEFAELLQFVEQGYFDHVGVFAYSREEDTKAFVLEPQIDAEIKENRRAKLFEAQQKIAARFLEQKVGSIQIILIDRILPDGRGVGRSVDFAPEIDGVVYVENCQTIAGKFIKGLITGNDEYNLWAREIL